MEVTGSSLYTQTLGFLTSAMPQLIRVYLLVFVLLSWGLSGCSVYMPLQPAAPVIREKGEAEVVGGAYLSGRLEASASYSPVKHVVVRAAGGCAQVVVISPISGIGNWR